jgi:hypothetical protein
MWCETRGAPWKILYPYGLLQPAATNPATREQRHSQALPSPAGAPLETQGRDHRCRLRDDGFQSGRAGAWFVGICGHRTGITRGSGFTESWSRGKHGEKLGADRAGILRC